METCPKSLNQSPHQIKHEKTNKPQQRSVILQLTSPGRDRRKKWSKEEDDWFQKTTESKAAKARVRYDARPKPPLHPSSWRILQISTTESTFRCRFPEFRGLHVSDFVRGTSLTTWIVVVFCSVSEAEKGGKFEMREKEYEALGERLVDGNLGWKRKIVNWRLDHH